MHCTDTLAQTNASTEVPALGVRSVRPQSDSEDRSARGHPRFEPERACFPRRAGDHVLHGGASMHPATRCSRIHWRMSGSTPDTWQRLGLV